MDPLLVAPGFDVGRAALPALNSIKPDSASPAIWSVAPDRMTDATEGPWRGVLTLCQREGARETDRNKTHRAAVCPTQKSGSPDGQILKQKRKNTTSSSPQPSGR
ncbi:hypothetical protein MAPG_04900 [Magnaporthiopsis poae ATCC 64411]|uniref:Uncharacterized protein n=1 Tax=Magnaporthiopsis poae (strain ATCC 64411 / 73-15) TaxID=644358 RepID=A0A0C4DXZ3_MAGP6|nr:hypothetical protein MAPG_04900 [Magnaporthiopsis poae ATCC 64411]